MTAASMYPRPPTPALLAALCLAGVVACSTSSPPKPDDDPAPEGQGGGGGSSPAPVGGGAGQSPRPEPGAGTDGPVVVDAAAPLDGPTMAAEVPVRPDVVAGPEAAPAVDADQGCAPPTTARCGGRCVDTSSDTANCGNCGTSCMAGPCVAGQCQCTNGVRDGNETDVDCGGGQCPTCVSFRRCSLARDCPSGHACLSGRCMPSQALVAYYDLEQSGPTVLDASPNGNHGTAANGAARAPGKVGFGYRMSDGACIRVPDSPSVSLAGGTAMTIMAWLSYAPSGCSDHAIIVNKEFEYDFGVSCQNAALQTSTYTSTTVWVWHGKAAVASGTGWQHFAATWDGQSVRQYLDGALVEEYPLNGFLVDRATGMGIGCRMVTADGRSNGSPIMSFTGVLDEVMIYSRALSATEIAAYYGSTK